MATLSTTANSRKRRPTMPPIIKMGMNTATSDVLMESTVKPISLAPFMVAAKGFIPASMWRGVFVIKGMDMLIARLVLRGEGRDEEWSNRERNRKYSPQQARE